MDAPFSCANRPFLPRELERCALVISARVWRVHFRTYPESPSVTARSRRFAQSSGCWASAWNLRKRRAVDGVAIRRFTALHKRLAAVGHEVLGCIVEGGLSSPPPDVTCGERVTCGRKPVLRSARGVTCGSSRQHPSPSGGVKPEHGAVGVGPRAKGKTPDERHRDRAKNDE